MASGDDYEVKMEDVIVQQNNDILDLQEQIDIKNNELVQLQEELKSQADITQKLEESLEKQNNVIDTLKNDVWTKDACMNKIESEISTFKKEMDQVLEEKESLLKQIENLEETQRPLVEENERMAKEESASRFDHEKAINQLKNDFSGQFKLFAEKTIVIEAFLEQQIELLLNRIKTHPEKSLVSYCHLEDAEQQYKDKLQEMKLSVSNVRENFLSDSFLSKIQDLSMSLPHWLSLEAALNLELKAKSEKIEKLENDLEDSRQAFSKIKCHEEQIESKIKEMGFQLFSLHKEKNELQQLLTLEVNKYEKAAIEFNKERIEIEKKCNKNIESYESDLVVLNNSLLSLYKAIPASISCDEDNDFPFSDSSCIDLNPSPDSVLNTNVCNAYKMVYKCLCGIKKHSTETGHMFKENQDLKLALDIQKKAVDEKNLELKRALGDLEFTKNKCIIVEKEKELINNRLVFCMEENKTLSSYKELYNLNLKEYEQDISSLKDQLSSLEDERLSLEKEVSSLKDVISSLNSEIKLLNDKNESYKKQSLRQEIKHKELLVLLEERSYCSLPDLSSLVTSTPHKPQDLGPWRLAHTHLPPPDSKGCGDQAVSHASTIKWMEKCRDLAKENKLMLTKISDLEIYNQDLKYTIQSVRKDMFIFKEKHNNLEKELNKYLSLKDRCKCLSDEVESKNIALRSMSVELEHFKNECTILFNKNIELEESLRSKVDLIPDCKLSIVTQQIFHQKVGEIVGLKNELSLMEKDRHSLALKVELLLESNNKYVEKLKNESSKLNALEKKYDTLSEEKIELISANKLLKKEIDLLELRLDYLSSNEDRKADLWKLADEIQKDLFKLLHTSKKSSGGESMKTNSEVLQLLDTLRDQLESEQRDFAEKIVQLQKLIQAAQEGISEDLLQHLDKTYRTIIEEQKHHSHQLSKLQQALESLQTSGKKLDDEDLHSLKAAIDVNMLKEVINEKTTQIMDLLAQKDSLEKSVKDLQKCLCVQEMRYMREVRANEKERDLAQLIKSHTEATERISAFAEKSAEVQEEALIKAEDDYTKVMEDIRAFFEEESASRLLNQNQMINQQIETIEKLVTERAAQISLLLERTGDQPYERSPVQNHLKKEVKQQLDVVLSALRLAHNAEIDLMRLQHLKTVNVQALSIVGETSVDLNKKSLFIQLENILKNHFLKKLKNFLSSWYPSYSKFLSEIVSRIKFTIKELREDDSLADCLELSLNTDVKECMEVLNTALAFVDKLERVYKGLWPNLEYSISSYINLVAASFENVSTVHLNNSESLKICYEISHLKAEHDELKARHRELVKLVTVRWSEVSSAVENSILEVAGLSDRQHQLELDHLKDYYVQMCSNLERQYTEDVNSLHSKLASLSISNEALSIDQDIPSLPLMEMDSEKGLGSQNFSQDQTKFIEELKCKWTEEINELKANLEQKYAKKMKDVHQVLSNYIYKNELDICARCLKEEVMRECEAEIAVIEHELSKKIVAYDEKTQSLSPLEREQASSQFPSLESCALSLATSSHPSSSFDNSFVIQTNNSLRLKHLYSELNTTLSKIDYKLKDKESKLVNIQNKLNWLTQFVLKNVRCSTFDCQKESSLSENPVLLIKTIEDGIVNGKFSCDDVKKIFYLLQNFKFEKGDSMKESREMLRSGRLLQEGVFEHHDEYQNLMKERDSLREMTATLKSAVTQLVGYLNTCEDELNKTVVDELLKICNETPGRDIDSSPRRVHFAPDVRTHDLDESHNLSVSLRAQLDSCLSKLKMEAASLLGLTSLHPPPGDLHKQIEDLQKEKEELIDKLNEFKQHYNKTQYDHLGLGEEVFCSDLFEVGSSLLADKIQSLISVVESVSSESMKMLEDLAKFGDKIITELQRDKIDLQQQIFVADKQLKSTRQFLEEQAQERENERDEYSKEVKYLQEQLKESNRLSSSQQLFSVQLQQLELQLTETKVLLNDSEKSKKIVEGELKDAIEKVWVLRDIISDLEVQLTRKSEKEQLLERKLDLLEAEFDRHSDTHIAMAQELESLRGQGMEDSYLDQIRQLQEKIKLQFDSSVVQNIKVQLHDMAKSLEVRTKELENLYLTNSVTSLSSPSEDLSSMEQLDTIGGISPTESLSPISLPAKELTQLQEKMNRHAAVEQVLMKRFRDLQLSCNKLSVQLEEMQAERDVIQKQMKKQMVLLAESNNKIDDLRHKVDIAQTSANRNLIAEIQDLKQKYSLLEQAWSDMQNELAEQKTQLEYAEETIRKQQREMQKAADSNHNHVQSLQLELASITSEKNKLEDLLAKQKEDLDFQVMNALLADKNEDIDHLQQTVNNLKNSDISEKQTNRHSKGHRVSFASEVHDDSNFPVDRLRDASQHQTFFSESSKFLINEYPSPKVKQKSDFDSPLMADTPPEISDSSEESIQHLINRLKSESDDKSLQIASLVKEIDYLKAVQDDLKGTKSELEAVLSSISEDKKYYESQLKSCADEIEEKNNELKSMKQQIIDKDEIITKQISDIRILEEISVNLQEKLKEAKELAEHEESPEKVMQAAEREKELDELKLKLTAYMNDLSDEKEFSETLKSSLNILTREKLQLEEKLALFEIENKNLSHGLQAANDKLNQNNLAVRHLKNYFLSKSLTTISDEVRSPVSTDGSLGENEFMKLKEEIAKMLTVNEQLLSERLMFKKEIEELKCTVLPEDNKPHELSFHFVQQELVELRKAVCQIKDDKLSIFSNFSSEIEQLNKEVISLRESKQELMYKLRTELTEKQELHQMYSKLVQEIENNNTSPKNKNCDCKKKELTFCDISILNIPPSDSLTSIDVLAEQMKNEIKLSKSLDNALLGTISFKENESFNLPIPALESLKAIEKTLSEEVKKYEETKILLNEKTTRCQSLELENVQLKLSVDRLERIVINENNKISYLNQQIESQKEKIINLELTILREQSNLKQVSLLLEHERMKGRQTQREDIGLIETMRQRLQTLMENELKLKKIVLEEKTKSERCLAEINSAKALEKFQSDSESKNMKDVLLDERKKYRILQIDFEKEKQSRENLETILTREREVIAFLRESIAKMEKTNKEMENEFSSLKRKLNEEIVKRQIAEAKLIEKEEDFDSRFLKYSQQLEIKKEKEIDAAYSIISELEREQNVLLRKLEELKHDHREKLRSLEMELERERRRALEMEVRGVAVQRHVETNPEEERLSEEKGRVVREVEGLIKDWLMAERQRRALIFQKHYLLVSLCGYVGTRLRLAPSLPQKRSFRTVVWAVIAALRICRLPCTRLLRYHKKKYLVLDRLKKVLFSTEVDWLVFRPTASYTPPTFTHSPPSKEHFKLRH